MPQLKNLVSQTGTISFKLQTDITYFNGRGQENYSQSLIKLPGVNEISFKRVDEVINISWVWERESGEDIHIGGITTDITDLPGPNTYFFQYTWDSALGISEGYINGQPLRVSGTRFKPWWVKNEASFVEIGEGKLKVIDLEVLHKYTSAEEAKSLVPDKYLGRHWNLTGFSDQPHAIDVNNLRGKLLYESMMDSPKSLEGWVKEGPLNVRFENGYIIMRSENFKGNTVYWCPKDFPESFIAEWDFEPLSEHGLSIVFFAAKGEHGEDIFDESLPIRDGNFEYYIKGAITSYHISYFAHLSDFQMGRPDSNLRKNNHFYRVGCGPVAIKPDAKGWQHVRLIKAANHIQLFVNGRICLDWTDDNPDRYGLPHIDGKIGFRQMTPTIGAYSKFRVWELNKQAKWKKQSKVKTSAIYE